MSFKNTETKFGSIAISLHWLMAIIIIGMLALGLYMTGLPKSALKLKLYGWHKEFGMLILMLAAARISWRLSNINPSLASLPSWERLGALAVHWMLYLLMFAMPITGWLITSAAGFPVSFFGLFLIPTIVPADENWLKIFETMHEWIAYGLIALIIGHTLAALKHHFIDKDDIFRRML